MCVWVRRLTTSQQAAKLTGIAILHLLSCDLNAGGQRFNKAYLVIETKHLVVNTP